MVILEKGRYAAREARTPEDLDRAQALRQRVFRPGGPEDRDAYDDACRHILVAERESGATVCCFRLLPLASGAEIARSYSAQFYDLAGLSTFPGPMVELGRFCIHPDWQDPDILRVAWGAMTAFVDGAGIEMLFGCSSFPGTDTRAYLSTFALLRDRHLAPLRWRPGIKAPSVFPYASAVAQKPDLKQARRAMPPLLRTYLLMGGWVSDHAVIDRDLGTLHVFHGA